MNILGIGQDLVELDRIRKALEQYGEHFMERCFTEEERRFLAARRDPVPGYAARFAAKEAGAKALGTGIAQGVGWKEIEVRRDPGQRPTLHFSGRAAEIAQRLGVQQIHVSLTHGRDIAGAFVILEGG
jgi:holo-[acyl-carrier protein] synthase